MRRRFSAARGEAEARAQPEMGMKKRKKKGLIEMTAECNHLIFLSEIKSALRYNVPLDVIRSRREAHSRRRLVMKAVGGEGDTSHPP